MTVVCSDEAVAQLAAILQEAFEEPPGDWYHFTDASPNSGYFGTIDGLEPEAAGRVVAGTSVAQQVGHVAFVMDTATALLRGDSDSPGQEQWEASWQTATLDSLTWQRMQEQLPASLRDMPSARRQPWIVRRHMAFGALV